MPPNDRLAQGLLGAVRARDFGATADNWRGGAAVEAFPSIDLALVDFSRGVTPQRANVLFSRETPLGFAAEIEGVAGAVRQLRFDADPRDDVVVAFEGEVLAGGGGVAVFFNGLAPTFRNNGEGYSGTLQ